MHIVLDNKLTGIRKRWQPETRLNDTCRRDMKIVVAMMMMK